MHSLPAPSLAAATDVELMTAIAGRSTAALEELFRRHRLLLRGVVMRVMTHDGEIDDAVQDVLLQIWHLADTYQENRGYVLGWLITMTRRRALDRVRMRMSYCNATERYRNAAIENDDQDALHYPDQEVSRHELKSTIESHLSRLPQPQEQAVRLSFLEGLSQREIARRLRTPLGTVKTRLELGLRKLRRAMLPEHAAA